MPYRILKIVSRNEYTGKEYSKAFSVSFNTSDYEIVRKYSLRDGDIVRCTVRGLFDSLKRLIKYVNADFDFEIRGTANYWTTCLYLPKDLVLDFGVARNHFIDLMLNEISQKRDGTTELVSIHAKRIVTAPDQAFPEYEVEPALTTPDLLIVTELDDPYYSKLKSEINRAFWFRLPTATLVLIRKLFENLILDLLREHYGMKRTELFYRKDKGMHHSLSTLISNLKENINDFKVYTLAFHKDKEFFKFLDDMKERADASAHSLDILHDLEKINSWKTSIDKYCELLVRTIQKISKTPKDDS